jgi:hypothetical protein
MKVFARVCVGLFVTALMAGCASNTYVPKIPAKAQAVIREYNEKPGNKVFILAVDPNGEFAYGYEYGKATVKEAAKAAVEQCDASREAYGVMGKPYVYAINNKVVYEDMIRKAAGAKSDEESRAAQKEAATEAGLTDQAPAEEAPAAE